jgi:hypothetical protein
VLNAFVEHALPEAERLRVVAHMADCAHCREVVFLARAAAGGETLPSPAVEREPRQGWFTSAFGRWRIALVPAGAAAALGGAVLWLQVHPVAMYKRAAAPASSGALPAAPPSVIQKEKEATSTAEMKPEQDVPQAASAAAAKPVASPRARQKSNAIAASDSSLMAMNAAPPIRPKTPGDGEGAGGPIHLDARSAAMARVAPLPGSLPAPPVATFAAGAPGSELQLAQAREQAQSLKAKAPVTLAAAPPPSPPAQTTTARSLDSSQLAFSQVASRVGTENEIPAQPIRELAYTRIAGHVKLPSGQNTVSSAAVLNRMVALDAAGGLFRSEDGGSHWIAVPVVWSGKAVEVKAPSLQVSRNLFALRSAPQAQNRAPAEPPAPPDEGLSSSPAQAAPAPAGGGPAPAAAKIRTSRKAVSSALLPLFHLVTDSHEVWVSSDGKEWRRGSIPPG